MVKRSWYLTAGFLGLLADQSFKWLALLVLPVGAIKGWGAGFGLTAYVNKEFAWSIPLPNAAVAILVVLLLLVGAWLYFYRWQARLELSPIFLIAAGALSNLIDRIARHGAVDYFSVPGGGVINLADILIFVGIILLSFPRKRESRK